MWIVAKNAKWIFCCPREDGVNARGSNLGIFTLLISAHLRGQTTLNKSVLDYFPCSKRLKHLPQTCIWSRWALNWSELICWDFPGKKQQNYFSITWNRYQIRNFKPGHQNLKFQVSLMFPIQSFFPLQWLWYSIPSVAPFCIIKNDFQPI